MIMKSLDTIKNSNSAFDVDAHIESRNKRHGEANIHSRDLLGLSTIELNITELCNRTCSFCPRHDPEIYPNQKLFMDLDTVRNIVKQVEATDWYGDVHITGFGEPHTHPQLAEIIRILKTSDRLYVEITTNGDRLIDQDINLAQELFDIGLDMLTVDCYDGDDQYNIRLDRMQALDGEWRLRQHYDTGNTQDLIVQYGFNNRSGIMGGTGIQNQCYLPFYKTLIDWNGNMVLCCNDWHRTAGSMGNVNIDGLVACWNSDRLKSIRGELAQGVRRGTCASCNIRGTKFGQKSFDLHTCS